MDTLQILFLAIYGAGMAFGAYMLITLPKRGPTIGNSTLAGALCFIFAGYTTVQLLREGPLMFLTNHSANLTGIQVWWDLISAVVIAFFFIAPRARAVGMNVVPWAIFAGLTASIGLLAMCARLFYLEAQREGSSAIPAEGATA
ncbi:MAG: hypothetical protein AAF251_13530 [Pseudomonadota bacterium]